MLPPSTPGGAPLSFWRLAAGPSEPLPPRPLPPLAACCCGRSSCWRGCLPPACAPLPPPPRRPSRSALRRSLRGGWPRVLPPPPDAPSPNSSLLSLTGRRGPLLPRPPPPPPRPPRPLPLPRPPNICRVACQLRNAVSSLQADMPVAKCHSEGCVRRLQPLKRARHLWDAHDPARGLHA